MPSGLAAPGLPLTFVLPSLVYVPTSSRPRALHLSSKQPHRAIVNLHRRQRVQFGSSWLAPLALDEANAGHESWRIPVECNADGEGREKSPWFGDFKVWWSRDKGKPENTDGNGVQEELVEELVEEVKKEVARVEADEMRDDESQDSAWKWPWQKPNTERAATEGNGKLAREGTDDAEKVSVKRVRHSDSKPAGAFVQRADGGSDEDMRREKEQQNLTWRDLWDGVIKIIAPNLKRDKEGIRTNADIRADPHAHVNEDLEEGDDPATDEKAANGSIRESRQLKGSRSAGVTELYRPPTRRDDIDLVGKDNRKSKWPQMPWSKDVEKQKPVMEKTTANKPTKAPRISRVPDIEGESTSKPRDQAQPQANARNEEPQNDIEDTEKKDKESDQIKEGATADERREREVVTLLTSAKSSPPSLHHLDVISIPQRDIASIRLIFGSETFFATETLSPPGGLIFRGNLRGEPKATLAKLEERLASRLGDKYTLCLAEGGEEDARPVVVIVPTARDTRPASPRQRFTAFCIGVITVTTVLARGMYAALYKPIISTYYPLKDASAIQRILSMQTGIAITTAAAVVVVILASQIVQRMVASRHGTRIALPYFIPSFQLGSFGAVVQLASPTPTRSALFDIALSGAATLVIVSLAILLLGLRMSTSFPVVTPVPLSTVSNSALIGFLTIMIPDGKILIDYGRSLIGLHPLAVIGANCLTIAALNLLPMRPLDGGRIISALYGRRTAVNASRITVLFLLLASTKNPYFVVFLAAMTFGPWGIDRPSKNELTEPNGLRTIVGYLFMLFMIGVLLPYPASKFYGTL
eukprot:GFKZ01013855.1.p1 GENE.GFKZ01013855.1~~GFKZ01013855.1.p1  ORF type:complete len:813 (-),score=113.79 GFKZ01013855.1:1546-3984(-)